MSVNTETASAFDFDKTFANRHRGFATVFQDAQFAWHQCG